MKLHDFLHKTTASSPAPPLSVMVPVATPPISAQLGWVEVRGLWQDTQPAAVARWRALAPRTLRARWGPVTVAQRQIWKDKGL